MADQKHVNKIILILKRILICYDEKLYKKEKKEKVSKMSKIPLH